MVLEMQGALFLFFCLFVCLFLILYLIKIALLWNRCTEKFIFVYHMKMNYTKNGLFRLVVIAPKNPKQKTT